MTSSVVETLRLKLQKRSILQSEQISCYHLSQIGPSPRSQYTELANGSLLLKPLSKDHHGGWECLATNRVATVSAGTVVMVLGELATKTRF